MKIKELHQQPYINTEQISNCIFTRLTITHEHLFRITLGSFHLDTVLVAASPRCSDGRGLDWTTDIDLLHLESWAFYAIISQAATAADNFVRVLIRLLPFRH